ncbi:MAG: flagellar export chaperone FlgN [Rhodothermales bacterium]|nr:flagellar export chaperone FlgN [Rhodothermales bacterium]
MNPHPNPPAPGGPAPLVHALIETLRQERAATDALHDAFTVQLDALREGTPARQHDGADAAAEALDMLGRLRTVRDRQTRLLGRVLRIDGDLDALAAVLAAGDATASLGARLRTAADAVRTGAARTRRHADALDFALRHAMSLGRGLIQAMRPPEAPRTYDATGRAARPASARPLVNHVG